jgi:hypothetical protein
MMSFCLNSLIGRATASLRRVFASVLVQRIDLEDESSPIFTLSWRIPSFAARGNGTNRIITLIWIVLWVGPFACGPAKRSVQEERRPKIEDYATIESVSNGVPVWSFSNLTYIYGVSPDLMPGIMMQEGNRHPLVKIRPKKSWEIKFNLCGAESEMTRRSAYNDSQPMLPIHLIDGDPNTAWASFEMTAADARPEWIRIDLPVEADVASVVLVSADYHNSGYGNYGKALPRELEGSRPVGMRCVGNLLMSTSR